MSQMSRQQLGRPLCSPTVEKLLLEIEGQPVKTQARAQNFQEPRNYTKENIKRLKEIQAICRQKDSSHRNPMRALHTTEIVPVQPSSTISLAKTKRSADPFLTTVALVPCSKKPLATQRNQQAATTLPRSNSETSLHSPPSSQSVSPSFQARPVVRSPSASSLVAPRKPAIKQTLPHELGSVPKYLQARKLQWKLDEEKKVKLNEESNVPAGHTLLSEQERLETLDLLKKTSKENAPELAMRSTYLATVGMATDQAGKLGIGKSRAIICMYKNNQVIHMNRHSLMVTLIAKSDANTGELIQLGNELNSLVEDLKMAVDVA